MPSTPLKITIECPGNAGYIFSGSNMPIKIVIKNTSGNDIGLPLEYMQRVGPFVKLTDIASGEDEQMRVNLVSHDLLSVFKKLAAQSTFEIEATIQAQSIMSFRTEFVDLSVRVGFSAPMEIGGEIVDFVEASSFRIIGEDTLERARQNL
jgi:hypothetical protein